MKRGVSGIAAVCIVAGLFVVSVGFLSWKFKQGDSSASQGFFNRTSALISKTFDDMFSSGQSTPAVEIDLGEQAANVNEEEIKNTSSSPFASAKGGKASGDSPHFKSSQQAARYLTEENKNSFSPAESPIVPSSANGINVSVTSSFILISDIQTTGGSGKSDDDFIKMYNADDSAADIGGWQLKKRTQPGTESSIRVFPSGASIASHGYFVWANSENNFASAVGANVSSTSYLSDNYSIALFDASGKIIDAVAWGSGHVNPFVEGSAYPTNPVANQILARKIVNAAMQDTDNNAGDFEIR